MTVASTAARPEVASRGVSLELIGLSRRFGPVVALGRRAFAAETDPAFADLAAERLRAGDGLQAALTGMEAW